MAKKNTELQSLAILKETAIGLRSNIKKTEAEIGPLKYIAEAFYGGSGDTVDMDRAVRMVIILLVIVFDPLAVVLLIAANHGLNKKETLPELTNAVTINEIDDNNVLKIDVEENHMSLLQRLIKNSTIDDTDVLIDSKVYGKKDMILTSVPMVNVALSGRIDGGLTPGLTGELFSNLILLLYVSLLLISGIYKLI